MIWTSQYSELMQSPIFSKPVALTIGNFDGVHLGHQQLIQSVLTWAKENNGHSLVITFQPHPAQILYPEKQHERLFDYNDQKKRLTQMGVDFGFVQAFSREFSQMSPHEFVSDFLIKKFHPKKIFVGHDFYFGAARKGDFHFLKGECELYGVDALQVPAFSLNNEIVSTSQIRKALSTADMEKVTRLLGRPYSFEGIVEKGHQRGRLLGFPTANIRPAISTYPRLGVYACQVQILQSGQSLKGVVNIGRNPTFVQGDAAPIKGEVFIFDFNQDIYGQELKVELCHFLRDEKKFAGVEELKSQIASDVQSARSYFG